LHARIELSLPLETHGWWHYIHRGKAYANDIHAVLHVIDANGNEVYFSETIMFETRHPNEVPFRDERIPDDASVIRIQRIDKLITFLNTHR
jgi:hypothetical protein